ncbi:hypothetical protein [Apilactobacillus micheneri]|uniref:hypothetical protein n=1 Tax=Apilactobacillus micheneri TaxID=1899430 RepID=UPI00112A70E3|nr:hypothetical protein [Apilactobacillus micheneri]TPR42522.1 hypothetical protein DY123_00620 [Apilactobacillus micheneri]TPR49994.1 hypothetical protein DY037_02280 [Apilactobacillus micheneri]TPR52327.1 hypothetical protein DY126_00625 [Apilactobacillus micheneri]
MKIRNFVKYSLITFGMVSIMSACYGTQAHAKYMGHHQTPTEIRGNWYQWDENKMTHMHIYKKSIYINGKKDKNKLDIIKHGKNAYNLYSYQQGDIPIYTLTHKKIHGKRALFTGGGSTIYWTRSKIKHTYF